MTEEIKKVHLDLRKRGSFLDTKLILVWEPQYRTSQDGKYKVRHFQHQKYAILELAEVLLNEDDDFANRLVEADRKEIENNNQRDNRYFAERKSELPERDVEEVDGIFLEVHGNRSARYGLAKTMCDVAGVKIKRGPKERHIEI